MNKPSVYVETSVLSYITARPSRDVITAGRQLVTIRFWDRRDEFDLVTSELVVREASRGDPAVAAKRIALLDGIPVLSASDDALRPTQALLDQDGFPAEGGRRRPARRRRRVERDRVARDVEFRAPGERRVSTTRRTDLSVRGVRSGYNRYAGGTDRRKRRPFGMTNDPRRDA